MARAVGGPATGVRRCPATSRRTRPSVCLGRIEEDRVMTQSISKFFRRLAPLAAIALLVAAMGGTVEPLGRCRSPQSGRNHVAVGVAGRQAGSEPDEPPARSPPQAARRQARTSTPPARSSSSCCRRSARPRPSASSRRGKNGGLKRIADLRRVKGSATRRSRSSSRTSTSRATPRSRRSELSARPLAAKTPPCGDTATRPDAGAARCTSLGAPRRPPALFQRPRGCVFVTRMTLQTTAGAAAGAAGRGSPTALPGAAAHRHHQPARQRAAGRRPASRAIARRGRPRARRRSRAAPGRANLVARLRGTGEKPPLLLTAHLDVVEADPAAWKHPPFAGDDRRRLPLGPRRDRHEEHGGDERRRCMRPARARPAAARARRDLRRRRRRGGRLRLRLAVPRREAPELVRAEYALGESGGFSLHLGEHDVLPDPGRREGHLLAARARVAASPATARCRARDSAVVRLGRGASRALGRRALPVARRPRT